MENKVIIGLDEYLDLRDRAQKVDKLKNIGKIIAKEDYNLDPYYNAWKYDPIKEIVISNKDLTEYINDILGVRGFEVRIEFEGDNKNE